MCGIVAGVSGRDIVPVLVQGLQRLEYRGYDSCGVAVHAGGLKRARSTARVAELIQQVKTEHIASGTGIAHTRWATHGAPAVHNAHPHFSHGPATARPTTGRPRGPGAQRHHRKPRRAARRPAGQGLCVRQPDRHRSHRPPDRLAVRRRRVHRPAGRGGAAARRLRAGRVPQGRAAPRGRRARRFAADPGRGLDGGQASTSWPATPWPWPA